MHNKDKWPICHCWTCGKQFRAPRHLARGDVHYCALCFNDQRAIDAQRVLPTFDIHGDPITDSPVSVKGLINVNHNNWRNDNE